MPLMPSCLAANLAALTRHFGVAPELPRVARFDTPGTSSDRAQSAWVADALRQSTPDVVCGIGLCGGSDNPDNSDSSLEALDRLAPNARLVLLEPNPDAARRALDRHDWTARIDAGRLAVLIGPDYRGLAAVARVISGIRQAPILLHPDLADRHDLAGPAKDAIARLTFQGDANAAARRALSGRYLLHTLANAPAIARESRAGQLAGLFAGQPAVIAAAGPSLDRNIHDLAPVLDRAIVIGCDTAAWPLLSAGVTPHLVVAVDASEANARHLSSFPSGRTALVSEGSVHPSALPSFAGRTFFFKVSDHEPWPWLGALGLDRARLDAWGSVATTAFALALEMGCNPIIFIGADFAFTGDRPYCRGTSFESIWASWVAGGQTYEQVWRYLVDRWPASEATGLDGRPVRTASHLLAFRDWVAERASARTDRRIVNATGAGLLMGRHIHQQSATSTLASSPALDSAAIAVALRQAHARGVAPGALSPLLASATSVVAGADEATVARWRAFTEDTIPADAIRAALASTEQRAWVLGANAFRQLLEAS
jgi:hypothetical protein